MDGPIVGAIITASVAVLVAIGTSLRTARQAAVERRYERRRSFTVDAQDAMLVLREALAAYGAALHDQSSSSQPASVGAVSLPGQTPAAATSFTMAVPDAVELAVRTARGRLAVARSRLEDDAVAEALLRWESVAQANLIDATDTETTTEEAAFAAVNELIRSALRASRGLVTKDDRLRIGRSGGDGQA